MASLAAMALLAACGAKSSNSCGTTQLSATTASGFKDSASTYGGLLFSTTDYTSSSVLFNAPGSGTLSTLDTGESGDPWLKLLGGTVYLFNRTATSLNFSTFTLGSAPAHSCQLATLDAAVGDPHDALLLDAHRLLLALNAVGGLVVIDPTDGVLVQTITADWQLGVSGAPFRPQAFYAQPASGGGQDVYVLHQGLDASFNPNGTQRIVTLHDDGSTVTVANATGIVLKNSDPLGFFPSADAGKPYVYGECSPLTKGSCTQGYEQVSLASGTSTMLYDTGAPGFKGNGGAVQGKAGGSVFYELMVKPDGKTPVVETFDVAAKTAKDAYTFGNGNGCCGLYFDDSSGTLYTGDANADGTSPFLAVLPSGQTTATKVAVSALPYSGIMVPASSVAQ